MFSDLDNVRLAAVRATVPVGEIRLEDEAELHGGSLKKIARLKKTLGMDRRRIAPPDVTASDLCAFAAGNLLQTSPNLRDRIEALIFVSQSPDWFQPATACELQDRLGLSRNCAAFDVNQGCTGYVYGLWLAAMTCASGAENVLLLVGDVNARGRDVRNRITSPVFGDGGSATLLSRCRGAAPMRFGFGTDGSGFESIIIPAGQSRIPFARDMADNADLTQTYMDGAGNPWQMFDTYMDGGSVFTFTMEVVPAHVREMLQRAHLSPADLNWLILHQANGHIVRSLAEKIGAPLEKVPDNTFSEYGNLASASAPVAMCDAFAHDTDPGLCLLCGFGIGLAWGSCICDLQKLDCAPVLDFVADPQRPTRQQRIDRWKKILSGEMTIHEEN